MTIRVVVEPYSSAMAAKYGALFERFGVQTPSCKGSISGICAKPTTGIDLSKLNEPAAEQTIRIELDEDLDKLFQPQNFENYGPNGPQGEGKSNIARIPFFVSAISESIQMSVDCIPDAIAASTASRAQEYEMRLCQAKACWSRSSRDSA